MSKALLRTGRASCSSHEGFLWSTQPEPQPEYRFPRAPEPALMTLIRHPTFGDNLDSSGGFGKPAISNWLRNVVSARKQ